MQTDTDSLSNSPPPFNPLVSERGPFAKENIPDAESAQNARSVFDARECDAIEVSRKQKARAREPVLRDDSHALQKTAQSISAVTKNYRCAMRVRRNSLLMDSLLLTCYGF